MAYFSYKQTFAHTDLFNFKFVLLIDYFKTPVMTVEMNSELQNSVTANNTLFTLTKEQLALFGAQHELLILESDISVIWKKISSIITDN